MAHAFDNRNFIPIKQPTFRRVVSPLRSNGGQSDPTVNPQYQTYSTPLTIEYPNRGRTEMFSDMKPPAINRIARMTSTTNNNYIRRPTIQSTPISNGLTMNTTYLNTTQLYISQPVQPQLVSSSPMTLLQNTSEANQRNSITIPDFNSSPCSSPVLGQAIYRSPVPSSSFVAHHHQVVDDRRLSLEETTREYFGECGKCGELITSSEDPCDILGRIYHSSCAVCVMCGRSVKNKHFFLHDHLYCEEDFMYTGFYESMEHCVACGQLIDDTIIQALGQSYHLSCFKCSKCSSCLDGLPFVTDHHRNLFCLNDYHSTYGLPCDKCSELIVPEENSLETIRIVSMGKNFHVHCYRCEDCSMQLNDEHARRCYPWDNRLLCQTCCRERLTSTHQF